MRNNEFGLSDDKVVKLVPYPELYKLYEDLRQVILSTDGLSLAGVIGVLEMLKIDLYAREVPPDERQ